VHWNFFFTVAAVAALTLTLWVPERALAAAALGVTLLHQATLSLGGVGAWVQSSQRGPGLVEANKEGLSSLWGYWALHLAGAAAGNYIRASCGHAVAEARACLQSGRGQASQVRVCGQVVAEACAPVLCKLLLLTAHMPARPAASRPISTSSLPRRPPMPRWCCGCGRPSWRLWTACCGPLPGQQSTSSSQCHAGVRGGCLPRIGVFSRRGEGPGSPTSLLQEGTGM